MKKLTDADIIQVMREQWEARVNALVAEVELKMHANVEGEDKPMVSPGLKVRHKGSQNLYTVKSVGPKDVILNTPEGESFLVDGPELEREYELD